MYQYADYRNAADIQTAWKNVVRNAHEEAATKPDTVPWEAVADKVRALGRRLEISETTFPIPVILPILLIYAFTNQTSNISWPIDLLVELGVPYEAILGTLESLFYRKAEPTWSGSKHELFARLIVYVTHTWLQRSSKGGEIPFGSEENAVAALDVLQAVLEDQPPCLQAEEREKGAAIRVQISRILR